MDWARLLGVQALGRRWRARSVLGERGVCWACVGERARAQAWALAGAHEASRRQQRARGAQTGARAGLGAEGRGRARGAARQGARAAGRQARARQGSRPGRGLGAGRAAWALGARPGRLGWPWAVHSVHLAHFRSVLTRFFP